MKKFYSVSVGEWFDMPYGSTSKRKAIEKANQMTNDPEYEGEEINIVVSPSVHSCDIIEVIAISRPAVIVR